MISLLLPLLAFASYEESIQKIDSMNHKANALIEELGFPKEGSRGSSQEEPKRSRLVQRVDVAQYFVPAGTMLFGKTITRLVVGSENSPVILKIKSGGKYQFFSELKALGVARQSSTDGRVAIEIHRVILHSGKTIAIDAVALDHAGGYGLPAEVFSGKAMKLAGAMVGSFLSGYASGNQTQSTNAFGISQANGNNRNSLLQGVAQTAADQSKNLIDEASKDKPVLVVEPGSPVTILLNEELRL